MTRDKHHTIIIQPDTLFHKNSVSKTYLRKTSMFRKIYRTLYRNTRNRYMRMHYVFQCR